MKTKKKDAGKIKETATQLPAGKKVDKKVIENHKQAAAHHIEAAKHHLDAAKHYDAANYEKAARSTMLAHGHHAIAGEFLNDNAKHHAQALKQTNYQ